MQKKSNLEIDLSNFPIACYVLVEPKRTTSL